MVKTAAVSALAFLSVLAGAAFAQTYSPTPSTTSTTVSPTSSMQETTTSPTSTVPSGAPATGHGQ